MSNIAHTAVSWLDEASPAALAQVTASLSESDRARLTEYWSRVIADAGADLPGWPEAPSMPARRARRVRRQGTVRLVRVLSGAFREAAVPVAAAGVGEVSR